MSQIQEGPIFPLRHHEAKVPIEIRMVPRALRVVERDPFGRTNARDAGKDTFGDLNCAAFWERDSEAARPMSGWAFAWPAVVVETTIATLDPRPGSTPAKAGPFACVPVLDKSWAPDRRFRPIEFTPKDGDPQYPAGTRGIVLAGTAERSQESLFFPAGVSQQLVAVHAAGDELRGTLVYDIDKDSKLDSDRAAHLQTAFRVVPGWPNGPSHSAATGKGPGGLTGKLPPGTFKELPAGPGTAVEQPVGWFNSIALNLTKCGRSIGPEVGGLVAGRLRRANGSMFSPGFATLDSDKFVAFGALSDEYGGPLSVGCDGDTHILTTDRDKRAINPVHISTRALYLDTVARDGPLAFEGNKPKTIAGPYPTDVRLAFNLESGEWEWYCAAQLDSVIDESGGGGGGKKGGGGGGGGKKKKKKKEFKIEPPPGVHDIPLDSTPPLPPDQDLIECLFPLESGESLIECLFPLEEPPDDSGDLWPSPAGTDGSGDEDTIATPNRVPIIPDPAMWFAEQVQKIPVVATTQEAAFGALLARPQLNTQGQVDYRRVERWQPFDRALFNRTNPITARIQPFGAFAGNLWNYTQRPGSSRQVGGTASGGFLLLPPEADLINTTPSGALSVATLAVGPGAKFGAGILNNAQGVIGTGWSWNRPASGASSAALLFQEATTVGDVTTLTDRVRMSSGGVFGIANPTGTFWTNIFSNAAVTDKLAQFPNFTGTVGIFNPVTAPGAIPYGSPVSGGLTSNAALISINPVTGKVTIAGGIDPTYLELSGPGTADRYINMTDGQTTPISAASKLRIRYNDVLKRAETSIDANAYFPFSSAIGGAAPTGNAVWVDAINGNDAMGSRASLSTPFRTIQAAIAAAVAGDLVMVLPGTYNETLAMKDDVSVTGLDAFRTNLTRVSAVSETIVTMAERMRFSNFTLNLSNAGGPIVTTGLSFPAATTTNATSRADALRVLGTAGNVLPVVNAAIGVSSAKHATVLNSQLAASGTSVAYSQLNAASTSRIRDTLIDGVAIQQVTLSGGTLYASGLRINGTITVAAGATFLADQATSYATLTTPVLGTVTPDNSRVRSPVVTVQSAIEVAIGVGPAFTTIATLPALQTGANSTTIHFTMRLIHHGGPDLSTYGLFRDGIEINTSDRYTMHMQTLIDELSTTMHWEDAAATGSHVYSVRAFGSAGGSSVLGNRLTAFV